MSVHTRILERRREVVEDQAKRNLGRLLRLLIVVVPMAVVAWVAFSPWLSVAQVAVEGAGAAAVNEILAEHRVVVGTPMILVDAAGAEAALGEDPWVAEASVSLRWPDEVSVHLVEHQPLAWVQTAGGWARRSVDGSVLPSPETPDSTLPAVVLPDRGEEVASRELLGALEWLEALPTHLRSEVVVRVETGELWADVQGHRVRLGRPVEMTAKATSLTTLLTKSIPEGAEINLIAPTHPAVRAPGGDAEPEPTQP